MIKIRRSDGTIFNTRSEAARSVGTNESTIRGAENSGRIVHGYSWTTNLSVEENLIPKEEKKNIELTEITIGDISNVDDDLSVSVVNNMYVWDSKGISYNLPIDVADKLFYDYSVYGNNLTSLEVRIKHNISPAQWYSLKGRLQLYKVSDIFSHETRNTLTDAEYRELVASKIRERDLFKKRTVIDEYNKFHISQATKWRDIANKKTFITDSIVNELAEWLVDRSENFSIAINPKAKGGSLTVVTADWHLGAGVSEQYNTPEYNREIIGCIIDQLAEEVNAREAESVTLELLGDYFETISGLNHINSWQGIESGMYGAKVVIETIERLFENLISKIANVTKVVAVAGNHDRSTSSNKEDVMGEIATLAFYFLNRLYGGKIEFIYDPFCVVHMQDGIRHILQHGGTNSAKKSESLINDYGDTGVFNLILTGHQHSRGIIMDAWNRRHVQTPSIFTGNYYSTQLGFSSVSGALLIRGKEGLPQITDLSFYSKLKPL
jgi:predicted phosphodiesterase